MASYSKTVIKRTVNDTLLSKDTIVGRVVENDVLCLSLALKLSPASQKCSLQELESMMERAAAQAVVSKSELPEDLFWFATQVFICHITLSPCASFLLIYTCESSEVLSLCHVTDLQ